MSPVDRADPSPRPMLAHDLRRMLALAIVLVVVLMGAAVVLPGFMTAQDRAGVARVRADMRSMAVALENYYIDNLARYPAHAFRVGSTIDNAASLPPDMNATATFRVGAAASLTTPIKYIESYPADPFVADGQAKLRYQAHGSGWILGSFGPDRDHATGGDLGWQRPIGIYHPDTKDPAAELVPFSYDATNGTVSEGDVWRVHQ